VSHPLQVVEPKRSECTPDGYVERFRRGFMPNSTVPCVRSMTPATAAELEAKRDAARAKLDEVGPSSADACKDVQNGAPSDWDELEKGLPRRVPRVLID
jgi:hypothetical protein